VALPCQAVGCPRHFIHGCFYYFFLLAADQETASASQAFQGAAEFGLENDRDGDQQGGECSPDEPTESFERQDLAQYKSRKHDHHHAA
jgi:hypothetical protein